MPYRFGGLIALALILLFLLVYGLRVRSKAIVIIACILMLCGVLIFFSVLNAPTVVLKI